jgi:hypothetical protein
MTLHDDASFDDQRTGKRYGSEETNELWRELGDGEETG